MDDKIKKIANHYGLDNQLNQTVEECAELIVAIQKYIRHKNDANDADIKKMELYIIEEIADVEIMTEQLQHLIKWGSSLCEMFSDDKLDRQLERIENEKEEK